MHLVQDAIYVMILCKSIKTSRHLDLLLQPYAANFHINGHA